MTVYVKQAAATIAAMGLCSFLLLLLLLLSPSSPCFAKLGPFFCFARICAIVHGSDNLTTHIRIYVWRGRIAILFDRTIQRQTNFKFNVTATVLCL